MTKERNLTREAALSAVDTANRLDRLICGEGTGDDWEHFTGYDVIRGDSEVGDVLVGAILEQYVTFRRFRHSDGSTYDVAQYVTAVVGIGGPHEELRVREDGSVVAHARWASGPVELNTFTPSLAAYLWESEGLTV